MDTIFYFIVLLMLRSPVLLFRNPKYRLLKGTRTAFTGYGAASLNRRRAVVAEQSHFKAFV